MKVITEPVITRKARGSRGATSALLAIVLVHFVAAPVFDLEFEE